MLREVEPARLPFLQVYRQTDDTFVQHLANCAPPLCRDAIAAINAASHRDHRPGRIPVVLAPTNARVDAYNRRGMEALYTTAGCSRQERG